MGKTVNLSDFLVDNWKKKVRTDTYMDVQKGE